MWRLFWEEIPVLHKLVLSGWSDMHIQIQWYINIWTQQYFDVVTFWGNKALMYLFLRFILFWFHVFKLGFIPCKAEQTLQGMELQEKETRNG